MVIEQTKYFHRAEILAIQGLSTTVKHVLVHFGPFLSFDPYCRGTISICGEKN
jgi:hypothetical protein